MREQFPMGDQLRDAPTFWLNVTTSANWHRSPVGIVRTEQEIRRHLSKILGARLQPIVFENGSFVAEKAAGGSVPVDEDVFWPEPSYGSSADLFDLLKAPAADPRSTLGPKAPGKPRIGYGDVLITMGLDWDHPGLHDEIKRLARAYDLTVIVCCYDLIPILFPQYCVGDVASWFKDYLIEMTWSADGVLCISENTRRDYVELASRIGLPARRTEVFKLGSSLPPQTDDTSVSDEVSKVLGDRFFLFVSTIERRKNHALLYQAYHLMRQEYPDAHLPKLVFVGMPGWGVGELMSDIRLDPLTKNDIVVLPHVSDSELLRLYEQCEAFLYPSFYEGWGLPVAEALQMGRPVIASNAGSIPEVGGDLVRYLDPWAPREWANELLKIANGQTDLVAWSKRIAATFLPYEWSSAAEVVVALATELRRDKRHGQVFEAGYDLSTLHGIHYGDKIIYKGRQGIVCHGPYIALAQGRYEVTLTIDWVETAPGILRLKADHSGGEIRLSMMEIETLSLRAGRHELTLDLDLVEQVDDFEVVCEVDCRGDIKVSVDRLEINRVLPEATQPLIGKVTARV